MKPPPFKYIAPRSLEEAQDLVAQYGDEAKLLAGGQSLIPAMNFRVVQPAVLIDINGIDELRYIRSDGNGALAIGAMTLQRSIELDSEVRQRTPLLHACMPHVAHPQIRNRGTLGGSLAHADPAAELPVVAIAGGARIRVKSADGDRWIEAREFFEGMFMTTLLPNEILVEVVFPTILPSIGWSFKEASRRRGDYAMMGVAVEVGVDSDGVCQAARLVYLNAGDGPVTATKAAETLQGQQANPELFRAAADVASSQEIDPIGNVHASVPYQRHLARVLTERALAEAFERPRPLKGR
jgi:carbon-monoxide dehydrogenase medium subunit